MHWVLRNPRLWRHDRRVRMPALPPPPRAALMLIGDELLSGKIQDENGAFLAKSLRARGVRLCEISVLPDHPDEIAQALRRLSQHAQWIFSSGGVGPTHDDCTMEGIAQGLGRSLQIHEDLEARLKRHYGARYSPEVARMAQLPEGARMYGDQQWPVTGIPYALDAQGQPQPGETHRVYVLPGIPSLFARKIEALARTEQDLPQGPPWEQAELELLGDESRFSASLRQISEAHPEVDIGSYPRWEPGPDQKIIVRVKLTFESRVPGAAAQAMQRMRDLNAGL